MAKKYGKVKTIDRFNRDPKEEKFISDFQEIMIQRLDLNRTGHYHPDNIKWIQMNACETAHPNLNTKIADGFLLSCVVDPEIYIRIQETAKKVTGDYMAMDDLIHLLLTYFISTYQGPVPKNQLPYNRVKKVRGKKLLQFKKRFKPYFKNTVRTFNL